MSEEEILQMIKNNLSINIKEESVYTGNMEGSLYEDQKTIQLIFDNEILCEFDL